MSEPTEKDLIEEGDRLIQNLPDLLQFWQESKQIGTLPTLEVATKYLRNVAASYMETDKFFIAAAQGGNHEQAGN